MPPARPDITPDAIHSQDIKRKLTGLAMLATLTGLGVLIGHSLMTDGGLTFWNVLGALAPAALLFAIAERAGRTRRTRIGLSLIECLMSIAMMAVVVAGVARMYGPATRAAEQDAARERLRDRIQGDTPAADPAPVLTEPARASDNAPDLTTALQVGLGFLAVLALLGTAAWLARRLYRGRQRRRQAALIDGDARLRYAALRDLRQDPAYTERMQSLLELAHSVEQLDPRQRSFVDRYMGELERLAGEAAEFRKHPDSPVAAKALAAFEQALDNTRALLAGRRDQLLSGRALTMETTAGVLGSLIPGRRRQKDTVA